MIQRVFFRFLLAPLCVALLAPWLLGNTPAASETTASPAAITPGPADGRVAWLTAKMLEQLHYARQPFDSSVSSKFLDRYLKTLDPQNIHFIQSDIDEFEKYRSTLDDLTATRRGVADTSPAFVIFNRFVDRLQQRATYADELLTNEKFTFDGEEKIVVDRDEMPHPKDLTEARKLWRERVRFEYLQELLGKIAAKEKEQKKGSTDAEAQPAKKKSDHEEIVDTLTHRYQRNVKTFRDFDNDDVLQVYLTALAHVYDPHSDYLGPDQLESFKIGMNLSLFGIGAELRSDDGYCTINRLLPGGPALKSGKIKEKDRIIAVGQSNQPPVDVIDMNLNKAVQLIRGPKGTEVRLTVVPAGADNSSSKIITLIRDEIPLEDQAAKARLIESVAADGKKVRLGVIDLPSFYASFDTVNSRGQRSEVKSTTVDVAKLLAKLKQEGVNGIVLDLRRNGGGSLEEAIRLTGLFIRKGPVVQVRDSDGSVEIDNDEDPRVLYDGPLVVLTSRFSASASEILAGALQDYGRALIVGDASTHGKGTVQSVNALSPYMQMPRGITNDPGALKVTIKKFYRASGASTQLKGVTPDIVLPSVLAESKDFGESSLDNPMPWDTIPSADLEHVNRVAPFLAELRRLNAERLANDPEFNYIKEDIAIFKKQQVDKTLSLNLQQRLKEKQDADNRQKARDKERLARSESSDVVYELTLKLAEKEGLPAPVQKTNTLSKVSGAPHGADLVAGSVSGVEADSEDEAKPASVDAPMLESQRILKDYLRLMSGPSVASTGGQTPVASGSGNTTAQKGQVITR